MKKGHVLIAEDDTFLCEMLQRMFKRHGVDVSLANNGHQAITSIERKKPGLLMLDLLMPEADGYDVLQRRQKEGWNFPVVILSNLGDKETQKKCKDWGAVAYFVKSNVDDEDLWPVVEPFLR